MIYNRIRFSFIGVLVICCLMMYTIALAQEHAERVDTTVTIESITPVIQPNPDASLSRGIFNRILGKSATKLPADEGCWEFIKDEIVVDLSRATELSEIGGAIRIEGEDLPKRVLLFRGDDNLLHAMCNKCAHAGRRLDPVPGAGTVQCCSMGKATYDYDGKVVAGSVKEGVHSFPVREEGDKVYITLTEDEKSETH